MTDRSKETRAANIEAMINDLVVRVEKLATSYKAGSMARADLGEVQEHLRRASCFMAIVTQSRSKP